jgi:hypothetical protein
VHAYTEEYTEEWIDFLTSVGIRIGFLLNCRFFVRTGFAFEIEKSGRFLIGFFEKLFFVV